MENGTGFGFVLAETTFLAQKSSNYEKDHTKSGQGTGTFSIVGGVFDLDHLHRDFPRNRRTACTAEEATKEESRWKCT